MLFTLALALALIFAVFVLALLRLRGQAASLLAIYLLAVSPVILSFEILGLAHALNRRLLFLGLQAALTLAAYGVWRSHGRPPLLAAFSGELHRPQFHHWWASFRHHPWLWLLALTVDLAYAVNAYLILVVPPNNNDSLYLHMARVARWLHTGSYLPFATHLTLQVYYPFNAQALIYWTVLFWGSDQLAGFVQFSAALASAVGVFALARLLKGSRAQSAFAALLWVTFPQVFFQSTTTQNDLVPAAFMVAGVYFLILGLRNQAPRPHLFLATLGISLALGTKQTSFFLLPGLVVLVGWLLWPQRAALAPQLLRWLPSATLIFLAFGAGIYLQNFLVYHNPMGDPQNLADNIRLSVGSADTATGLAGSSASLTPIRALWINVNRIVYEFLDTTGLPPFLEGYLFRGKAHLARLFYQWVHLPLESALAANPNTLVSFDFFHRAAFGEDEAWFGLFAPLLLVPAGLAETFRRKQRSNPLPATLWILAGSFTLCELLFRPGWDVYLGRNFILAIVFLAPFAAAIYRRGWAWRGLAAVVVILSAYSLADMALNNTSKPLVGQHAIWSLSRADKVTLQDTQLREPAHLVERSVPANAVLAIPNGTWEFPFYDPALLRQLASPDEDRQLVDPAWLQLNQVQYVLLEPDRLNAAIPVTLQRIDRGENWALYRVTP
jgi:hypothetical protein